MMPQPNLRAARTAAPGKPLRQSVRQAGMQSVNQAAGQAPGSHLHVVGARDSDEELQGGWLPGAGVLRLHAWDTWCNSSASGGEPVVAQISQGEWIWVGFMSTTWDPSALSELRGILGRFEIHERAHVPCWTPAGSGECSNAYVDREEPVGCWVPWPDSCSRSADDADEGQVVC